MSSHNADRTMAIIGVATSTLVLTVMVARFASENSTVSLFTRVTSSAPIATATSVVPTFKDFEHAQSTVHVAAQSHNDFVESVDQASFIQTQAPRQASSGMLSVFACALAVATAATMAFYNKMQTGQRSALQPLGMQEVTPLPQAQWAMAATTATPRGVRGALSKLTKAISGGKASQALKQYEGEQAFGKHLFDGHVADGYLKKRGVKQGSDILKTSAWTTDGSADKVAGAVLDWARDHGASVMTHWFQPLAASGVREGGTGQVHNKLYNFNKNGEIEWELEGSTLLKGETDGSSFPNGGLRATHRAGGYTVMDPGSRIFLYGDTIYVPSIFVTWSGDSVDEKTPLLRSIQAVSKEGKRLMKNLGWDIDGIQSNIGLEQEFFLVPREYFLMRTDLQMTGRTVMGKDAPRGQEMCDHYMGPPYETAMNCMQEIQEECYKIGIPLRTRHREVAPNQYEFAPYFGHCASQIDQNLMVMQIATEVATKHGLACLFNEKPFAGINGSGKHNNWSLATTDGVNLLNPRQVTQKSSNTIVFPLVMAAMVRAIDLHGDLMRCAIASPGNDFRLGACEAPPAIMSTYLGDDITNFLEDFKNGNIHEYTPSTKELDCGVDIIAPFAVPSEDRNRTSPFPYGGCRFEFRAVGSSQNVSLVNTVLAALAADSFRHFSEQIEAGAAPEKVAQDALTKHWRCIFNGNGYDAAWPEEADERGIWRIDSGVEAMNRLRADKNVELFESLGIFTKEECEARSDVLLDFYSGCVEMEALCMVDMIMQQIIPVAKETGCGSLEDLLGAAESVQAKLKSIEEAESPYDKATIARVLRLETMESARKVCDATEATVPAKLWPMSTYKDLLFLDYTHDNF